MSHGTSCAPTLYVQECTTYRLATAQETLAAARRAISQQFRRGHSMSSPKDAHEYLRMKFATLEHEVFCLVLLDNRHHLLAFVELFRGTIDGAAVHPREVVKEALKHNAAAVILAHNHPSGIAEASQADRLITQRLREALQLVDIRVLDHLIVAGDRVLSFAESGLL